MMKLLSDGLPRRWRSGAIDDECLDSGLPQEISQSSLGLEKLCENNCASFAARERLKQLALLLPTRFQGRLLLPGLCRQSVREFLQRLAPGCGAASGGLQQQPPPQVCLARAQPRQAGA